MGALADSVREVLELNDGNIAPPLRMGAQAKADCLRGIGNHDGRFILILDVDRVFATDELLDMEGHLSWPIFSPAFRRMAFHPKSLRADKLLFPSCRKTPAWGLHGFQILKPDRELLGHR